VIREHCGVISLNDAFQPENVDRASAVLGAFLIGLDALHGAPAHTERKDATGQIRPVVYMRRPSFAITRAAVPPWCG
jgi:hypothetical protein